MKIEEISISIATGSQNIVSQNGLEACLLQRGAIGYSKHRIADLLELKPELEFGFEASGTGADLRFAQSKTNRNERASSTRRTDFVASSDFLCV